MPERTDNILDSGYLRKYRFRTSKDIEHLFQRELSRFPYALKNGLEQLMFSEFGGLLIRPKGEPINRLTHIVFPETIISIPDGGEELDKHSERSFPQAQLLADEDGNLYVKIMADFRTDDRIEGGVKIQGKNKRDTLILSMDEVYFNSDLWDFLSPRDKKRLVQHGFQPKMNFKEWGKAILKYREKEESNQREHNGKIIHVKELPGTINQKGAVGRYGTFHLMPGMILNAIHLNAFTEGANNLKEYGSVHIHPTKLTEEMSPVDQMIVEQLGYQVKQMTVSPSDVAISRASSLTLNALSLKYLDIGLKGNENFLGILGVDRNGQVFDSRYIDFGLLDDNEIREVWALNDRIMQADEEGKLDIGLLRAHYEFFSNPEISSSDFTGDVGQHVGDPDYDRSTDPNIDQAMMSYPGHTDEADAMQ